MVGWHHRLSGHGFGWTPGAGDGQGGLACCSPWGRKEADTTERLKWETGRDVMYFSLCPWSGEGVRSSSGGFWDMPRTFPLQEEEAESFGLTLLAPRGCSHDAVMSRLLLDRSEDRRKRQCLRKFRDTRRTVTPPN